MPKFCTLFLTLALATGCAAARKPVVFNTMHMQQAFLTMTFVNPQDLDWQPITGKAHGDLLTGLIKVANKHDTVVVIDPKVSLEEWWGEFNARTRIITIAADLGPDARVATLAHELGHLLGPLLPRPENDIFAEAVSYQVSAKLGIDTGPESFAYLQGDLSKVTMFLKAYHAEIDKVCNQILREMKD